MCVCVEGGGGVGTMVILSYVNYIKISITIERCLHISNIQIKI